MIALRDRYRGCLLGGGVGDALGVGIEFLSLAEIRQRYGPAGVTGYVPAYGRAGAITDDTQMTVFTADAWFGLSAAGRDPELFSAFVALDQPLNPEVHIELHKATRRTYAGFAAAMQVATGTEDLARRLASVPSSRGGVVGDHAVEAELLGLAADLSPCDPHIFDAWVNDDVRGLVNVPELMDWPGRFLSPLLFVYGNPRRGLARRSGRARLQPGTLSVG